MSIFNTSVSPFRQRRQDVIYTPTNHFFYASWFLLRMRAQDLILSSNKAPHHFQRDRYVWRKQGLLRKARKTFPKSPKQHSSAWKLAYRWHIQSMPLT
jgi:hypothetical protein